MRTLLAALLLLAGCPSDRGGQTKKPWAEARPGWPVMVEGVESVEVSELLFGQETLILAGSAKHGITVGGRLLSEVPGAYVVAVDMYGAPKWVRTLESDHTAGIDGMIAAPDGGVIFSGFFDGTVRSSTFKLDSRGGLDCMLGRANADGSLAWLRSLGSPGTDLCRKLALGAGGTVWVAGSYDGPWNSGTWGASRGMKDVVVLGIDARNGNTVGAIEFGSAGDDLARSVAVAPDGGLLVTGSFGGPFGDDQKLRLRQGDAVMELSETISLRQTSDYDGFAVSIGSDSAVRWATAVASPGFDVVKAAIPDGDGFLITGSSQLEAPPEGVPGLASDRPLQGFVSRLDAQGQVAWTWTDPRVASGHAIAVVRDRIAVLGHHRDGLDVGAGPWRVAGTTGVMLALLDRATGEPVSGYGCDGPGSDYGYALAATMDGRIAIAGETRGPGGCAPKAGEEAVGFVRLMALDAQGQLRALSVE